MKRYFRNTSFGLFVIKKGSTFIFNSTMHYIWCIDVIKITEQLLKLGELTCEIWFIYILPTSTFKWFKFWKVKIIKLNIKVENFIPY